MEIAKRQLHLIFSPGKISPQVLPIFLRFSGTAAHDFQPAF
jgi:hypothetical protein